MFSAPTKHILNDGGQIRTCQSFPISYQVTTLIQENLCSLAVSYMSSTCLTHFLICQTCSKNVPSQRLVRGGRVYFNTNIYFSFLQFFQEFVTNKHWVHLDIAGVMMNKDEVPYLSKGMSGKKCVCVCCLLYTSPSPRDEESSRMPSSA